MRKVGLLMSKGVVLVLTLLALGCGGTTGGPGDSSGGFPTVGVGGSSTETGGAGVGGSASGGSSPESSGGTTYQEPECPDVPPPPVDQECDPFNPTDGCGQGYGCYPFLQYPYGQRCGFAQFGSVCLPASSGGQNAPCGDQDGYCEPGYMCVIGGGGGARCARLCELSTRMCPAGLICTATDVQGYGVCF